MRTFEKDFRYLLQHIIPHHKLTPARRRQVVLALQSDDPRDLRSASVLALEELCQSQYFQRTELRPENGHVIITYVRTRGYFRVRIQLPSDYWPVVHQGAGSELESAPPPRVDFPSGTELTFDILPEVIETFSIDDRRESIHQKVDAVVRSLPEWLGFIAGRLILVEETTGEPEAAGDAFRTMSEKEMRENVVYDRCWRMSKTEVLEAKAARALHIAQPLFTSPHVASVEGILVAVVPVTSRGQLWGMLEVWLRKQLAGQSLDSRLSIAASIVARVVENCVKLAHMTSIDRLTGIYNRHFYDHQLRIEIERATRSGTKLSMLVLDLDDFKFINDTFGHQTGDEALRVVADLIKRNLRKIDLAFRYGGEEFVILLPGTAEAEAIHTAERLRLVVDEHDFRNDEGKPIDFSVSIGAAVFPDHAHSEEELFAKADAALRRAKESGKNRVEFHTT